MQSREWPTAKGLEWQSGLANRQAALDREHRRRSAAKMARGRKKTELGRYGFEGEIWRRVRR